MEKQLYSELNDIYSDIVCQQSLGTNTLITGNTGSGSLSSVPVLVESYIESAIQSQNKTGFVIAIPEVCSSSEYLKQIEGLAERFNYNLQILDLAQFDFSNPIIQLHYNPLRNKNALEIADLIIAVTSDFYPDDRNELKNILTAHLIGNPEFKDKNITFEKMAQFFKSELELKSEDISKNRQRAFNRIILAAEKINNSGISNLVNFQSSNDDDFFDFQNIMYNNCIGIITDTLSFLKTSEAQLLKALVSTDLNICTMQRLNASIRTVDSAHIFIGQNYYLDTIHTVGMARAARKIKMDLIYFAKDIESSFASLSLKNFMQVTHNFFLYGSQPSPQAKSEKTKDKPSIVLFSDEITKKYLNLKPDNVLVIINQRARSVSKS